MSDLTKLQLKKNLTSDEQATLIGLLLEVNGKLNRELRDAQTKILESEQRETIWNAMEARELTLGDLVNTAS